MKGWAERINSFFIKYEARWELFMLTLALLFVFLGLLPEIVSFSGAAAAAILAVDWTINGIFFSEFTLRISLAPSKRKYLKEHWMDLVALIPYTRFFRLLRLIRVIRILKFLPHKYLQPWDLFWEHLGRLFRYQNFFILLIFIGILLLLTSAVAFWREGRVNPGFHNYAQAMWWAIVTMTTVGYGDIIPITTLGRLMAVVLMIGGFGLWATFAAVLTSYLIQMRVRRGPAIEDIKNKLDRIRDLTEEELVALQGAVDAILQHRLRLKQKAFDPKEGG